MLRRGGATAAAFLTAGGLKPAAARQANDGAYVVVRRYQLTESPEPIRNALLGGYLHDICQAPGFQSYFAVEGDDNVLVTIAVFDTQQDFAAFAAAEADWVARNLSSLLPSPTESISGQTAIHVGNPNVRVTCDEVAPVPPTTPTAPAAPTTAPAQPTPTAEAPCLDEGCVCTTGTRQPCNPNLVCCPTTDLPGGPGVCQTEDVCYPRPVCVADGSQCTDDCNWGDTCDSCCSGWCGNTGQCTDEPARCTGEGCDCNAGVQNACDPGLVCCQQGAPIPGGAGTCMTEAECEPPCTSEGCDCATGTLAPCDDGLICCPSTDRIGGPGTCLEEDVCYPPQVCVADGDQCTDDCAWGDSCDSCCSGYCGSAGQCGEVPPAPLCVADGDQCTDDCAWGDFCGSCCSGFCGDTGQCAES